MKNKVFLGGTCAETTWRQELIKGLNMEYFDPVVKNWTEADQAIEENEKNNKCNVHLYVLTSAMIGVYSVAEAVESVFNQAKHTVVCVIPDGFSVAQRKSLKATLALIDRNGGKTLTCVDMDDVRHYLNKYN